MLMQLKDDESKKLRKKKKYINSQYLHLLFLTNHPEILESFNYTKPTID